MPVDYHLHTALCKHATGEPEAYCRRALERGIREIGFSDHSPMPPDYDPECRMERGRLGEYVEMVRRAAGAFPGLVVRLGLEADFHPGTESYVREMLREHELDYVIGSVHYIGDWAFDNPDHQARFADADVYDVYREYYDLVTRLAETGLFDILGHPDLVKKFGHRPARDFEALERKALGAVAKAGMAIDVNTSGLRKPCREIYPSERILRAAREMDIPVTLGSDAHRPEDVGAGLAEGVSLLRRAGYTRIRKYRTRGGFDAEL